MLHRYRFTGIHILILSTVITVGLYILSKPVGFDWQLQPLRLVSQVLALLGTVYLSLTFILSSRVRLIESVFGGLDIVYKLHQILGAVSFVFLLHHPLLLAVQKLPNVELAIQYLIPGSNLSYTAGIAALVVMILLLMATFFIRLPYHIWKQTHTWMGSALFLSMVHVFLITSDISRYLPLRIWILFWMSSAAIAFILKAFVYKWYADSYTYMVESIDEINDTIKVVLRQAGEKKITFMPGQFVFLSVLDNPSITSESHPFSVASGPGSKMVTLYCKKTGDYVDRLSLLSKNTVVTLNGPYGSFMEKAITSKKIVAIAGGIGVTPFLSLLEDAQHSNKYPPITLFHLVKDKTESLLETVDLQSYSDTCSVYVHPSKTSGRLSISEVLEKTADWEKSTFFLCGPLGMMESMRSQLLSAGVRPSKVIFEDFSFK